MVKIPELGTESWTKLMFFCLLSAVLIVVGFVGYAFRGMRKDLDIIKSRVEIQKTIVQFEIDAEYTRDASMLVDYCYRSGYTTRFHVIKTMLEAIDKYLPAYFPEGPYTKEDFIALALTETSNFNQYCVGTSGEKGLFQIMPNMCKAKGIKKNQFDIDVNTELSMFVLSEKFKKHQDYYKALIAYNGVIIIPKTKRWRDKYWKRFISYRGDTSIIFSRR